MKGRPKDVADMLYSKMKEVAVDNARFEKVMRLVKLRAQRGLRQASGTGASAWRDALRDIIGLVDRP